MDRSAITRTYRRVVPKREGHRKLTAVAIVLLVLALIGLFAHFYTADAAWTLGVVAFAPYLMLASVLAVIMLLIARQWIGVLVAIVVVALCVSTQIRLYKSADLPQSPANVIVMTANLHLGQANARSVVAAVRKHRVDVLMLEELTPLAQQHLVAAGLNRLLPHHASDPGAAAAGTGLWSRYRLSGVQRRRRRGFLFAFVTARVALPGVRSRPTVAALHMSGPVPDSGNWNRDIARLPGVLRTLPPTAPVIAGGDFNATPDTVQFRTVLGTGYRDAVVQAGAGTTRTYPSDEPFPPLIAIDHVLSRAAVGQAAATIEIPGSDHRALVVTVAVSRAA